jgi:hypothetical protein
MIHTIRLDADTFIGKSYEEMIWDAIKNAKIACPNEFKICFCVTEGGPKMIKKVSEAAQTHLEALQFKTTIKLWENCKKEFVFLDVYDDTKDTRTRQFRFASRGTAPGNIIGAFNFLVEHHKFIRGKEHEILAKGKKQKRNDSIDYDYNK